MHARLDLVDRGIVEDAAEPRDPTSVGDRIAHVVNELLFEELAVVPDCVEDFADRDDVNWMKHTLASWNPDTGKVTIDYRPVHSNTMTNEVQTIPPKARGY